MTDILDQAQKLEELQRKVALENRFKRYNVQAGPTAKTAMNPYRRSVAA